MAQTFVAGVPPAQAAAPTVAVMQLTNASSQPVLLLWDQGATQPVVATGDTGPTGELVLEYQPTTMPTDADNWFNFILVVGEGKEAGIHHFSRQWTGTAWRTDEAATALTETAPEKVTAPKVAMSAASSARSSSRSALATAAVTQAWTAWVKVANVPSARDMKTTFTYGAAGNSEISVMANSYGNWHRVGTSHISNSAAAASGFLTGPHTAQYSVTMRFENQTVCAPRIGCWSERKAVRWNGHVSRVGITNWNCQHGSYYDTFHYPIVTNISKTKGTNRTYEVGATVPPQGGIDFASRSGYGTTVKMEMDFRVPGDYTANWFCIGGSNAHWPTASTLYATAWQ